MKTDCPSCGRTLRVPDGLRGKRVKCPSCTHPFKVPVEEVEVDDVVPGVAEIDEDDGAEHEEASREEREDKGSGRRRRRRPLEPHRGTLILTLGILGILLLPIIFGPIAWRMGSSDLHKMSTGIMDPEGRSVTNAGRICGIIGTIWGVLCCAGYGVIFLVAMMGGMAQQ